MQVRVRRQCHSAIPVFVTRVTNGNGGADIRARAIAYLAKVDPAISGQSGHNTTMRAACDVVRFRIEDPDEVFQILMTHYNPRCQPPWSEAELRHKAQEACKVETRRDLRDAPPVPQTAPTAPVAPVAAAGGSGGGPAPPHQAQQPAPASRPKILVTMEEHEVIDKAVAALANHENMFQRTGRLVMMVRESRPEGKQSKIRRKPGTPYIKEIQAPHLRDVLTKVAVFGRRVKTRSGNKVGKRCRPPVWCFNGVMARQQWEGIRHLEGIVEAPTLRSDGSIVEQPGWDRETGLFYEPACAFPKVPNQVNFAMVQAAVDELLAVIDDFPFSSPEHGSVWLAALLTVMSRHAIDGPVPLFLFDATTSGSGKSKLCDLISVIATGREITTTGYTNNDEEMDKRLTTLALSGDPIVMFDNLPTGSALGSPSLDRVLTSRFTKGRILGRSENTGDLPINAIFMATGNNLTLKADALRRVVPCRLETELENPEERDDFSIQGDLVQHVKTNRPQLVCCTLTILKGFIDAGRPEPSPRLKRLGGFDAWSELIRNTVYWAIKSDPCATRAVYQSQDNRTQILGIVLRGLAKLPGIKKGLSTAEILRELEGPRANLYQVLKDALGEWARKGPMPTSQELGVRFREAQGRPVAKLKLVSLGNANRARAMLWTVRKTMP